MSLPSAVCLTGVRSAGIGIAGVGSGSVECRSSDARRRRASLLVLIIVCKFSRDRSKMAATPNHLNVYSLQ